MGEAEIVGFLNHLAVEGRVAASTPNQALSALLFLDKVVLGCDLDWFSRDLTPARTPERLPVVLTRDEVRAVLGHLSGHHRLAAMLMCGAGLRLVEAMRLRVKDVDFGQNQLVIREGKGDKDRVTVLPATLVDEIRAQIRDVRALRGRARMAGGFGACSR